MRGICKTGPVIVALLLSINAMAADIRVTLTVDRTAATVEDQIVVKVEVEGKMTGVQPQFIGIEDFDVHYAGQSRSVQIINGSMKSSLIYQYVFVPRRAGSFVIGPAVVTVGGQPYRSNTATIQVGSERSTAPEDRTAYMTAGVDNASPFVGEQVLYTVRFYTRLAIQGAQFEIPDFQGLWKEQLGDVKRYEKVIDGQMWQIGEIKYALFPTSSGTIEIDGARLGADLLVDAGRGSILDRHFFGGDVFSMFRSTEHKVFKSNAVTLNVRPLPEEGKPSDFSGLVGSFSLSSALSADSLEVGDSATMTITISGDGDLRNYSLPAFTENRDFKVYDDQPKLDVGPQGRGVKETKIFRKAIVPLVPGRLSLPMIRVSYFDSGKGEYRALSTLPASLNVVPSSNPEKMIMSHGGGAGGIAQEDLKVLGDDLMPVKRVDELFEGQAVSRRWIMIGTPLSILPVILFVFFVLWRRRLDKISGDRGYIRRGRAFRVAEKGVKRLKGVDGGDFYREAGLILRDYIGDRCGIDGRALTAADIARKLGPMGVDGELCSRISNCLQDCDAAIYSGRSLCDEDKEGFVIKIRELIKELKCRV